MLFFIALSVAWVIRNMYLSTVPMTFQSCFVHCFCSIACWLLTALKCNCPPMLQCSTTMCCANQWSNASPASTQNPSLSPRTTNEIPIFLKFSSFTGNTPDKYNLSGNTSLKSRVLKVILSIKYISTSLIIQLIAAVNEDLRTLAWIRRPFCFASVLIFIQHILCWFH